MKCKCPEVKSVNASSGASPALPSKIAAKKQQTQPSQRLFCGGHIVDFSQRNIAIMKSATYIPKMNTVRQPMR
jgi:hypothetical protein